MPQEQTYEKVSSSNENFLQCLLTNNIYVNSSVITHEEFYFNMLDLNKKKYRIVFNFIACYSITISKIVKNTWQSKTNVQVKISTTE